MTVYIALLRAVNVGGTGKLAMADLRDLARACGFAAPRTYIASGNLVFETAAPAAEAKAALEAALAGHCGRPVGVVLRTADELAAVLAADPFPQAPGNRLVAVFLDAPPPADALAQATGRAEDERLALGEREIWVWYGQGMAASKLKIPAARAGTARNRNTVAALLALARA